MFHSGNSSSSSTGIRNSGSNAQLQPLDSFYFSEMLELTSVTFLHTFVMSFFDDAYEGKGNKIKTGKLTENTDGPNLHMNKALSKPNVSLKSKAGHTRFTISHLSAFPATLS